VRVTEIRDPQGGRNFIRSGDRVKVRPQLGRKGGFTATFEYADVTPRDRLVISITVFGGPRGRAAWRTFRPEHIFRKAQTRDGEAVR
jgi:hypothetical protein